MTYRWVGLPATLAIHDMQIAEHGGLSGVRDTGLLESALARPLQLLAYGEPDVAALAACYASGLCRNHPFADGNKRTAWLLAVTFLDLNGYDVDAEMTDALQAMLSLAAGTVSEEDFAAWLRAKTRKL
jgi:death-on-curing protein